MCGIFGCVGKGNLLTDTINGLKILEYRGYDSVGVTYCERNHFQTYKTVGTVEQLIPKLNLSVTPHACLGHTRWATNGGVSEVNSHPHFAFNQKIAVAHNGIIENYAACKTLLAQYQIKLQTNVDTEVIPNILYLLKHNKHNIHNYLSGQYVFCAYNANRHHSMFLAKKGNLPLFIARSKQALYISSDTLALPRSATEIIALDDLDTCEIIDQTPFFYHQGQLINKPWQPFTQSFIASDKNGFNTYMEKEINEIPAVLNHIINYYQNDPQIAVKRQTFLNKLNKANCVHVCGCGTSYHAALIIADLIEKHLHRRAKAHISSELSAATLLDEPSLAIIISQSGETADTLACMSSLQNHNIPVIALCNVTSSTIARRSQICFPLLCGPEIAVASTKVFCAAVLVGCLIINCFSHQDYIKLPQIARDTLRNARKMLPLPAQKPEKIFFIGKGLDYYLALEAALKVKEVTYTHCEGFPANELKHGPLSMINQHTLSVVFESNTANATAEITARGGQVINITPPHINNPLAFITQIIPAQIFALDLATQLNINPDKPRNLAKSVTVL